MGTDLTLEERGAAIDAALAALDGLGESLWQASCDRLGPLFAKVDLLGRASEAAQVGLLAEAVERGETLQASDSALPSRVSRSHLDWVKRHAAGMSTAEAYRLVRVTEAI